ncbi:MAG: AAA family ATPase [Candidatus Pacebacteria bacterium]|nr:AAA family ATPase [Candidatus Paceibacterota bacterium]
MKINDYLKQSSLNNILSVESVVSNNFRNKISKLSKNIIYIILFVFIFYFLFKNSVNLILYKKIIDFIIPKIIGLLFINIGLLLFSKLIDFYFSSTYYFEKISKNNYSKDEIYTFSAGRVFYAGRKTDILHGFIDSEIGKEVFLRLGISDIKNKSFYNFQKIEPEDVMPKNEGDIMKLEDIINYFYDYKPNFVDFLNGEGISKKDLLGALNWVIYKIESEEYEKQWWRPEILLRNKGLFDDWSFGKTYVLDKYSRNIIEDEEVNSEAMTISNREAEIIQIENALSKSSGSNAMLVGNPGQEKMQVIWSLCRNLKKRKVATSILGKKAILLLVNSLTRVCKSKDSFEEQIQKIFNEIIHSGKIFLVIDNLTELINTAKVLGSDFTNIFNPFLKNNAIQVISLVNTNDFHQYIEQDKTLSNNFEVIYIKPLSTEEIIKIISASALKIEKQYNIYYTYQAIKELAEGSIYYFSDGVSSDKAVSLLNEISPWAKRNNKIIISKDEVLDFIEKKTNIPTSGRISTKEKDKLTNLEELLQKRVIGQNDAIIAISNALRRARTGVRSQNKPIGSFLFFGPTGVGKTETTKALAYVFFGGEENMMRFDMSEYQTEDAIEKLIGSFTTGKTGILSNILREKQYGVVLLDEFEKANKDVLNLFLQIFDEGFFSDMTGTKINTRNIIFIATSNVGADTIFKMVNEGKNPKDFQDEIIADIVSRGLFKPELINRFDGTIIFKPLEHDDLSKIANLMLKKVSERILGKGLSMEYSDEVVEYIITNGTNKVFGARPMNRFIQDSIEAQIAKLIISGEAVSGKTIKFIVENDDLLAEII